MSAKLQEAIKLIKQHNKPASEVYLFFQSLLYGTYAQSFQNGQGLYHYNFYSKRSSECIFYLHQNHVGMLICMDKLMTGVRRHYNMKNFEVLQFNSEYEMDQNLQKHKYLIIKEKDQETILIFSDTQKRNKFKDSMEMLQKIMRKIPDMYDPMILKAFIKADTNQNNEISWSELKRLVRMMKIDLNEEKKQFIKTILNKSNIETIQFSEFQRMWKIFYCRKQMLPVFQKYDRQNFKSFEDYLKPKLDINQFQKFLIEQQKQTLTDSKRIIELVYGKEKTTISFYEFCLYIFGPYNNLLNEDYKNRKLDTSFPLNYYYCHSSHNTYLTGDQLFSDSRVERYLVDLENGLRCVELDIHDGSDRPIIKHGYTATNPVDFEDVIKQIKRFADRDPQHTPIILSLQNHCNQQNQIKMANILKQNFNDKILKINTKINKFPSLEQCKGKIIIKGPGNFQLYLKNYSEDIILLSDSCSEDSLDQQEGDQTIKQQKLKQFQSLSSIYNQSKNQFYQRIQSLERDKKQFIELRSQFRKLRKCPTKMQQFFRNENDKMKGIIFQSNKAHKFHEKYKVSNVLLKITSMLSKAKLQSKSHWESNSFSQSKLLKLYNNPTTYQEIRELSNHKWMRSYPDGFRILSSNYDPLPALQLGVQIIALNTQNQNDVNCHILKAFFSKGSNQTTGYRLKYFLSNQNKSDKQIRKKEQNLMKANIQFISGLRIEQNEDDFKTIPPVVVKAYFNGSKRDKQLNQKLLSQKPYTDIVQNQSFNPRFNKNETIQIKCRDPQLGFLIVEVPYCGRSVIPVQCMKNGWRVISLYDHELKQKESRLLCKIEVSNQTIDQ